MARVWHCKTKNIKLKEFLLWSLGRGREAVIRCSFGYYFVFYGGVFYQWFGRLIIRGGNHERDELSTISGTFYISHTTVKVLFNNENSIIYTIFQNNPVKHVSSFEDERAPGLAPST